MDKTRAGRPVGTTKLGGAMKARAVRMDDELWARCMLTGDASKFIRSVIANYIDWEISRRHEKKI